MSTLRERLAAGYGIAESGCWEWKRSRNSRGYGLISDRGVVLLAHRVSYELHVGPIPEGMTIDHLCRVKACVNPAHMEVVSREENSRRGSPGTGQTHCKRGHELAGANVMVKPRRNGRTIRNCRACHESIRCARKFARDWLDRELTPAEIDEWVARDDLNRKAWLDEQARQSRAG